MFLFASDLSGQAGASATCPCPFCERKINVHTSLKSQMLPGKRRSCHTNRQHYKKMIRQKSTESKHYASVVADPLTGMLLVCVRVCVCVVVCVCAVGCLLVCARACVYGCLCVNLYVIEDALKLILTVQQSSPRVVQMYCT